MRPITDINELHKIILDMAKEFDKICQRHHINYYMLGGSMLGAITHKGFIPWDDDMDFGLLRPDYERIEKILMDELPEPYRVLTYKTSKAIGADITKIENKRTVIIEQWKENLKEKDRIGINIDILPIDYSPIGYKMLSREWCALNVNKIQGYRYLSIKGRSFLKKCIAILIKLLFFWFTRSLMVSLQKMLIRGYGDFVFCPSGAYGKREFMPKDYLGIPQKYTFENYVFNGVAKPKEYLSALYGDYLKLPPKEKRHIHIIKMFWK